MTAVHGTALISVDQDAEHKEKQTGGRHADLGCHTGPPGALCDACPACALAGLHPSASAAADTAAAALGRPSPCTCILAVLNTTLCSTNDTWRLDNQGMLPTLE